MPRFWQLSQGTDGPHYNDISKLRRTNPLVLPTLVFICLQARQAIDTFRLLGSAGRVLTFLSVLQEAGASSLAMAFGINLN